MPQVCHLPLAEPAGQVPLYYADSLATIEFIGITGNMRFTYVEVRRINREYWRVPVLELIRPRWSWSPNHQNTLLAQAEFNASLCRMDRH